jgi:hypothetical protein
MAKAFEMSYERFGQVRDICRRGAVSLYGNLNVFPVEDHILLLVFRTRYG